MLGKETHVYIEFRVCGMKFNEPDQFIIRFVK